MRGTVAQDARSRKSRIARHPESACAGGCGCAARTASVTNQKYVTQFPGGASRLAALLLPQILPVFLVVAPYQPGAALRDLCNVFLIRDTRIEFSFPAGGSIRR